MGHLSERRDWTGLDWTGLDWTTCRALLEKRIPGAVAQATKDADTLFGVELPAIAEWTFGPDQVAAIGCGVLSVLGTNTLPLSWRSPTSSAPHSRASRTARSRNAGHLLHIQHPQPVARAMADFMKNYSMVVG